MEKKISNKANHDHSQRSMRLSKLRSCLWRHMHVVSLFLFALMFSVNSNAQSLRKECGIPSSEGEGLALNWYSYVELELEGYISNGEALISEYSTDNYCGTETYESNLEVRFENSKKPIGEIIRDPGINDECQFRKIVSGGQSPFEFHTKFKRRLYTLKSDDEFYTIFVVKGKGAIKFNHLQNDSQKCIEIDI